ncbi:MAG: PTS glucose transporter subunit IIA [Proteobacteria bacterium]|nr:PTS glucose transporter subunit IIA [Pseudomonadota bacterium]
MGLFSRFAKSKDSGAINSPVEGKAKTLKSLKDGVFSEKMMGDGVVIAPSEGKFYAPISGTLTTVFPTGHAYGITDKNGVSVLVHIGLDTVNLKGEGFTPAVKQGQKVKQGDLLVEVDLDFVAKNAPTTDTIMVVTPETKGETTILLNKGAVTTDSKLIEVK